MRVDDQSEILEESERLNQRFERHPLVSKALDFLAHNLPDNLYYHSIDHTREVLRECLNYASFDGLPERDIELLAIAAAFHDTGFAKQSFNNERFGADYALEAMREVGGFSSGEIELVERMILDTSSVETASGPVQVPSTHLSRYLLDADLSNLGRDDFFEKVNLQLKEAGLDEGIFLQKVSELIQSHRWHTAAAWNLRQKKKEQNIADLQCRFINLRESGKYVR